MNDWRGDRWLAGAIAAVVGTVDKLTTVGAPLVRPPGASPTATRAFCPGVG
jgi:hypothetical protein